MERAAHVTSPALGVERLRDRLGVGVDLDDRVEAGVDDGDAGLVFLDQGLRGEAAARHLRLQLRDGDLFELRRGRRGRGSGTGVRDERGHGRCGRCGGDALAKKIATRETVGCAWMGQGFLPL